MRLRYLVGTAVSFLFVAGLAVAADAEAERVAPAATWAEVTVHYSIKDGDKFVAKQMKLADAGVLARLEAAFRPGKSEGAHCSCDELNWIEVLPKGEGAKPRRIHFCHSAVRIGRAEGLSAIGEGFHKLLRDIVGKVEGKTVYLLCDNKD